MDTARVVEVPEYGSILLFGAVRGLASEVERLMTEIEAFGPDVIAIADQTGARGPHVVAGRP